MKYTFSKYGLNLFFLLFVCFLFVEFIYVSYMCDVWHSGTYGGYFCYWNIENVVFATVLFVVMLFLLEKNILQKEDVFSCLVVEFLYIVSFVPFLVCVMNGYFINFDYVVLNSVFWINLLVSYRLVRIPVKMKRLFCSNENMSYVYGCALFFSCLILFVSYLYTGFRFSFDLADMYELRLDARTWNVPAILQYLLGWSGCFLPVISMVFLIKKKFFLVGMMLFIEILHFALDGQKAVMLGAMLPFLIYLCDKVDIRKVLIKLFLLCMTLCCVENLWFGSVKLLSVFSMRMMFLPNQIAYNVYDFLLTHPCDFFRGSFLRHFGFETPYPDNFFMDIGAIYYKVGDRANSGLIVDALLNMWIVGIFVLPFLLVVLLKICDVCTFRLDKRLIFLMAILIGEIIVNVPLSIAMMTNGALPLMLLCRYLPRNHLNV